MDDERRSYKIAPHVTLSQAQELYNGIARRTRRLPDNHLPRSLDLSTRASKVSQIAYENCYAEYFHNSKKPQIYLIGATSGTGRSLISLLERLDAEQLIPESVVYAEGFNDRSPLLSALVDYKFQSKIPDPEIPIRELSRQDRNMTFAGNDSFELYKKQMESLLQAEKFSFRGRFEKNHFSNSFRYLMQGLSEMIEREKKHIIPHMKELLADGEDVFYILNLWHLFSEDFGRNMIREGLRYITFVPQEEK